MRDLSLPNFRMITGGRGFSLFNMYGWLAQAVVPWRKSRERLSPQTVTLQNMHLLKVLACLRDQGETERLCCQQQCQQSRNMSFQDQQVHALLLLVMVLSASAFPPSQLAVLWWQLWVWQAVHWLYPQLPPCVDQYLAQVFCHLCQVFPNWEGPFAKRKHQRISNLPCAFISQDCTSIIWVVLTGKNKHRSRSTDKKYETFYAKISRQTQPVYPSN